MRARVLFILSLMATAPVGGCTETTSSFHPAIGMSAASPLVDSAVFVQAADVDAVKRANGALTMGEVSVVGAASHPEVLEGEAVHAAARAGGTHVTLLSQYVDRRTPYGRYLVFRVPMESWGQLADPLQPRPFEVRKR